jgi:hypothetical protein
LNFKLKLELFGRELAAPLALVYGRFGVNKLSTFLNLLLSTLAAQADYLSHFNPPSV